MSEPRVDIKNQRTRYLYSQATERFCQEYDINWFNRSKSPLCTYDTVHLHYWVNVFTHPARSLVWNQLSNLIEGNGIVYVVARTDKDIYRIKTDIAFTDQSPLSDRHSNMDTNYMVCKMKLLIILLTVKKWHFLLNFV